MPFVHVIDFWLSEKGGERGQRRRAPPFPPLGKTQNYFSIVYQCTYALVFPPATYACLLPLLLCVCVCVCVCVLQNHALLSSPSLSLMQCVYVHTIHNNIPRQNVNKTVFILKQDRERESTYTTPCMSTYAQTWQILDRHDNSSIPYTPLSFASQNIRLNNTTTTIN